MKRSERSMAGAASGRGEGRGKGCPDARSDLDYVCVRCGRRYGEHSAFRAACPTGDTFFLAGGES